MEKKHIASTSSKSCKEEFSKVKLYVILTNKGMHIHGEWTKEKLLSLLTERLVQTSTSQLSLCCNVSSDRKQLLCPQIPFHAIIHRGIYSERVLKELQVKGMSEYDIVKAMKLGLLRLNFEESMQFEKFGIRFETLSQKNVWSKHVDPELISILKSTGLKESKCWNIMMDGVISQHECTLLQLALSGIGVSEILNWHDFNNPPSASIIQFLRKIGITEKAVQSVLQNGIDDGTSEMLTDLGYIEKDEPFEITEKILDEWCLTIFEQRIIKATSNNNLVDGNDSSTLIEQDVCGGSCIFDQSTCPFHLHIEQTEAELTATRNDYLRQNVMIPLSWAMSRTLKYGPTDPKYYTAYQLLRWKYLPEEKKNSIQSFLISATAQRDAKLEREKQEEMRRKTEDADNELSVPFLNDFKLQRIGKHHWLYSKKSVEEFGIDEFQTEICSDINLSEILNSSSSSSFL